MTYRRIVPNNNHYNCSQTFQLFLSPLRVSLEHSPWSVKQQSWLSPFLPLLISSVYVAISYCLFRGLSFSPVECLFFCIFILLLILIPCLDVIFFCRDQYNFQCKCVSQRYILTQNIQCLYLPEYLCECFCFSEPTFVFSVSFFYASHCSFLVQMFSSLLSH